MTTTTSNPDLREGRYPAKDEWQLRRQCPSCMEMNGPADSACQSCGLTFFKRSSSDEQSLRDLYVTIGGGAMLLAGFIGTALHYL